MSIFRLFSRKKQVKLTDEQRKWNKMRELWANEGLDSPYQELMTYQSEVNNGGHAQYFSNLQNCRGLENEMSAVCLLLSPSLTENLNRACQAYLTLEEKDDASAEQALKQCDGIFYQCETEITQILEDFALQI